ncbi:hypothetical protein D3C76_1023470 [compost metagenome]
MRVSLGPAMPREVLATGSHASRVHTADERPGQLRGTQWITLEGPAADHGAALVIQVQHRGKAEVQANRQHLGCHQPTALFGQVLGVVVVGQRTHGGQAHKTLTQALHAAAFLVYRQNQVGPYGADRRAQLAHLARAVDVAGKDDQAGHFRLAQQVTVFGGQPFTGDIHHQGALQADGHG